jgi:hypothetical protein
MKKIVFILMLIVPLLATGQMSNLKKLLLNYSSGSFDLPTVTTTSVSEIYHFGGIGGGNVTSDGGATVTARGIVWSKDETPTLSDDYTTDGTGTGSFESDIVTDECGETFYVRAYATNSVGTSYGSQVSFTTTSVNLSSFTGLYRVFSSECPDYDISIISEQTAKDAADLHYSLS